MSPNNGLNQFLPITSPGNQEHETCRPYQVTEQEHPRPNGKVVAAKGVIPIDQLGGIQPQVVAEPTHEIGAGLVELSNVSRPDRKVLPVPVEGEPTHRVQGPEHREVERIPS